MQFDHTIHLNQFYQPSMIGTLYAQVGANVPGSKYVFYGALSGIVVVSLIDKSIKRIDCLSHPKNEFLEAEVPIIL